MVFDTDPRVTYGQAGTIPYLPPPPVSLGPGGSAAAAAAGGAPGSGSSPSGPAGDAGGNTADTSPATGAPATTGFDPALAALAITSLGRGAFGVPFGGLATAAIGKGLATLGPQANLTTNIEGVEMPAMEVNTPTGLLGQLGALFGLSPAPATIAFDALGHAINVNNAIEMQHAINPAAPSVSPQFGWTDTFGLTSNPAPLGPAQNNFAPQLEAPTAPPDAPAATAGDPATGGSSGVPGDPGGVGSGQSGPAGAGVAGPGSAGPTGDDGGGGGGGGGDGGSLICTELRRQGLMDDATWQADEQFGSYVSREVRSGYQLWARPLARGMTRSRLLTNVVACLALPWAREMAYLMGARRRGSLLGRFLMFVGLPLCTALGRRLA